MSDGVPEANVPTNGRLFAVGDIHGCDEELRAMLAAIDPRPEDKIVFLGDYVDRGPDSKGVLDRLITICRDFPKAVFLRGNHELMMTRSRKDRGEMRMWLSVGGMQALASYGKTPGLSGKMSDVPEEHWRFIEDDCRDYFETDTHVFVHANLYGDLPLEEQDELMLFWEFLTGPVRHVSGKTVVCGHTSQKSGKVLDLGDTICIDTYAYGGGKLTCLCAETREYWQADILGRATDGIL